MSAKTLIVLVAALILSACGGSTRGTERAESSEAIEAPAADLTAMAEFHRPVEDMLTASAPIPTQTPPPTNTPTPTETPVPTPLPPKGVLSFSSNREGNWEIFVIQADGSTTYNITNNPADDDQPTWSPGGNEVLFTSDRDGDLNIYRMLIDGSGVMNLTPHDTDEVACDQASPEWSIDGLYIRFYSTCEEIQTEQVFKYDRSELSAVQIESDVFTRDSDRGLSPDGALRLQEMEQEDNLEIMIGPPDGSDWINLTNSPGNDHTPVWSPDGRYIAFVSDRDGNQEIYLTTPDGSILINLTNSPGDDIQPDWNANLVLDAHPPAPTPTPTATATPTPVPRITFTPNAIIRRPNEGSNGDAYIQNDTGAEITIYMYGHIENYIFYIPPGRHKIRLAHDNIWPYTILACGGRINGSDFSVGKELKVWCDD